jgi:NAD(P)-dependent dehydrogenase (short-subunit alcohol dehydrogenase family)
MNDQRTILITGATDGLGRALAGGRAAGGAQLILHGRDPGGRLVSDPALAGSTGRFYDREDEARAHPSAYDPQVQRRLWQLSLGLTGAPDLAG